MVSLANNLSSKDEQFDPWQSEISIIRRKSANRIVADGAEILCGWAEIFTVGYAAIFKLTTWSQFRA